jgi:hypothetical protein
VKVEGRPIPVLSEADERRFRSRVALPDPETGCMLWLAGTTRKGYGCLSIGGRKFYVHRIAWFLAEGPAPGGTVMDHLCRNHRCVNPAHLEPVTVRENTLRGIAGAHRALVETAKTHCPQGHLYDEANTRIRPNGHRACRACGRIRSKRWRDAA